MLETDLRRRVTTARISVIPTAVGYVCLGLGRAGRLLKEAGSPTDLVLPENKKALLVPPLGTDSFLRRVTITDILLGSGFNPDQPRDANGRWTGSGGTENSSAPVSTHASDSPNGEPARPAMGALTGPAVSEAALPVLEGLSPVAIAGLAEIAAGFAAATAFLGLVFIPFNQSLISSGTVPNNPDITYRYDQGTGVLTLNQNGQEIFSGHSDLDGVFRDEDGDAFGRRGGSSLVLDPDAAIYNSVANSQTESEARVDAQTDVATDTPKLCPDPEPENVIGRSQLALAYQEQITSLPRGLAVELNGVSFDGCRESDGTMLEAKSGYEQFMSGPGIWQEWFTGLEPIEAQMQDQSLAAAGRVVEWHFAQQAPADYFREFAEKNRFSNVRVIWTPAE